MQTLKTFATLYQRFSDSWRELNVVSRNICETRCVCAPQRIFSCSSYNRTRKMKIAKCGIDGKNTHFKGGSKYQFLSGKYIITAKGFSFTGYLPVCKTRYKRFWCVRLNHGLNHVSEIYCSFLSRWEITHETELVWKNWFRKVNLQSEMLFVYDLWHVSHGWGFLIKMSFCSSCCFCELRFARRQYRHATV